ncbi:MAG: DUF4982 domain-containing protein [Clostridia bacterium]|nr:DUF4982 domain-containing protein [Clostridia bacterium]
MRELNINKGWFFENRSMDPGRRMSGDCDRRTVDLPHDYMIETDVRADAPSGASSGYYNAGVAYYSKSVFIPAEWAEEHVFLRFDGAMMNATVEVNGAKAALHHYGYAPFEVDITQLVYPGKDNRIAVTLNASMQPNSRWYSGAGLFRGVTLVHTPAVHIACDGIFAWTKAIDFAPDGALESAYIAVQADVRNETAANRLAEVECRLTREGSDETLAAGRAKVQIPALSQAAAYMTMTVDAPELWSAETPSLYRVHVTAKNAGTFKTRPVPCGEATEDADSVLFGIRTVTADVRHGLRVNGQGVKLRGGCLHHDNGVIGAASLYDAEYRKLSKLKESGFNAVRTTHNPPSAAFIEACDRLGIYVFDEAFDVWGMGKVPGDYNQFFASDWRADLAAFMRRDRSHPCVILWSTGNEITERGGLGDGYALARQLAEAVHALDPSRPVSNAICSFWNGLDDELTEAQMRRWRQAANQQNADLIGEEDWSWEDYTEAFANGLDIVGYNYLEQLYARDHARFPERVMLGSENFPKEIGRHWPMIEKTPYVIGDFTWTAWDYIGEAGIGKSAFFAPDEYEAKKDTVQSHMGSDFPWRTANDADFDITGHILPQGVYRRVVWHSGETGLFSYDPADFGKEEILTRWGFTGARDSWTWPGHEGAPVGVVVFSEAEEVALYLNGRLVGRQKAGEKTVPELPLSFLFETVYEPGALEAVSFAAGREVSRAALATAGQPARVRLIPERTALAADGCSLAYVRVEIQDENDRVAPHAAIALNAAVSGAGSLMGFGSGNPITAENYTSGRFTSYRGRALAVVRAGWEQGEARLCVDAGELGRAEIVIPVESR